MVLDEWHLQIEVPPTVALSDAEAIRQVVSNSLDAYCRRLPVLIWDATGVDGVRAAASQ
ncbi:MAG: hypothetical protein LC808_19145 [Actinobacteria bacterium]|nr:hypothetical protein [Actinomycetota bacterium]